MRRHVAKTIGLLSVLGLVIGLAPAAHAASPIGNFESIAAEQNGIRVIGWTIDPDTVAPIAVHVYINGGFVGGGTANLSRPDVDAAYHKGANHGFNFYVPSSGGTVCAWAIDSNGVGPNIRLGCKSFPATAQPVGNFEATTPAQNGINVVGWALDSDTTAPIEVHVYINNKFAGGAAANQNRPDVDAAYHKGANHGFNFRVPNTGGTVCVFALNFGGGTNPRLGCKNVPATADPVGSLESSTPTSGGVIVSGWASDPDTTGPIEVHAYFNNNFAASALANTSRPDVDAVYHNGPNHGFSFKVPTSGPGVVCVYAINFGGGNNPLLGCPRV